MLDTNEDAFDYFNYKNNEIKRAFYFGICISKREEFTDNSCRELMIRNLKSNLEYPSLMYCENFRREGFIVYNKSISCDDYDINDFTLITNQWLSLCKEQQKVIEKVIKRFMPLKVGKLEIKIYCL